MKKIFYIAMNVFFLSLFFVSVNDAYAHTLSDVVKQIKKDGYYTSLADDTSKIVIKSNGEGIIYTFTYTPDAESEPMTITTEFTYKDGVINYKFNGDKENYTQIYVDNALACGVVHAVGALNGIDSNSLYNMDEDYSDYNFKEHGLEAKSFTYKIGNEEDGYVEGTCFKTLKISIDKFTLGDTTKKSHEPSPYSVEDKKDTSKDDSEVTNENVNEVTDLDKQTPDNGSNISIVEIIILIVVIVIILSVVILIIMLVKRSNTKANVTKVEDTADEDVTDSISEDEIEVKDSDVKEDSASNDSSDSEESEN